MYRRRSEKAELVRRVPLFARCTRQEIAQLVSIADEIELPAGKTLMTEGERGREFYILLEGTAEVRKNGRVINRLGPGDFFGEIALISRSVRTATVSTTSEARALVITDRDFRGLLDHSPRIQIRVLEALADRLAPSTL